DGLADARELKSASNRAHLANSSIWDLREDGQRFAAASYAAAWVAQADAEEAAMAVVPNYERAAGGGPFSPMCEVLRCIFRRPSQGEPAVEHVWLAWSDGAVRRLAQGTYDGCLLPGGHLDPARLGILCDALLEAGCPEDAELLLHLREKGPHWKGCW